MCTQVWHPIVLPYGDDLFLAYSVFFYDVDLKLNEFQSDQLNQKRPKAIHAYMQRVQYGFLFK
jgi:hypothetical protein